eukprot:3021024-Pyramimonas_sp.AAC.1
MSVSDLYMNDLGTPERGWGRRKWTRDEAAAPMDGAVPEPGPLLKPTVTSGMSSYRRILEER